MNRNGPRQGWQMRRLAKCKCAKHTWTQNTRTRGRPIAAIVRALSFRATRGLVEIEGRTWPCAIGRSGMRARKREGDGATPIGCWRMLDAHYRADRRLPPRTGLQLRGIRPDDGWCDDAGDRNYNRRVRHPYPTSAEHLWRDDGLYDLIVVLGYNARPRIAGCGSAIFMHIAHAGYRPTAGCIALSRRDLELVLAACGRRATVVTRR